MKVYFENEYFVVKYSTATYALVNKWITNPTSAEFREGMEILLQAMIHFKTSKMVSDTTYMGALLPEDQEWAASHWYIRASKIGFSHNGIIIPSDIFTEMSVQGTLDAIEDKVTVTRYFDNLEDAMVWISQVN
jgi:hypothetical protein